MGVIDQTTCPVKTGSIYPEPYNAEMAGRSSLRLGEAAGLTQFGANLVTLEPGARSSLRHWHEAEDEFVLVTEGELTLLQDEGEYTLRPGDCAAWKAGDPNGHCFLNRTPRPARFLVVGAKAAHETAHYSDVDFVMHRTDGRLAFTYRDGAPWTGPR
ncbi:MAG TPA: cupin domain-containing protein [Amaricoccus sp.]|nr:cupin domain-containing protein [Amaricoccus sp.]